MFKVLLFSWMISKAGNGVVDLLTPNPANRFTNPTNANSMASQESIRLGYMGTLMDICGNHMNWEQQTMLEILQRGSIKAARYGATKESMMKMYDVGAKEAGEMFDAPPAAAGMLCQGARKELISYVNSLDFEDEIQN